MSGDPPGEIAAALLHREARLLDRREWDAWMRLYHPDAVYWVPSWRDEYETVDDPRTEISLIYHASRVGLEERIARIESRKSITALPLPRTVHHLANIEILEHDPDRILCEACFAVHVFDPRTAREHTRHGRYRQTLIRVAGEWVISRKVITLVNDVVPTVLDFYSI